jgi:hypothetical protein
MEILKEIGSFVVLDLELKLDKKIKKWKETVPWKRKNFKLQVKNSKTQVWFANKMHTSITNVEERVSN